MLILIQAFTKLGVKISKRYKIFCLALIFALSYSLSWRILAHAVIQA